MKFHCTFCQPPASLLRPGSGGIQPAMCATMFGVGADDAALRLQPADRGLDALAAPHADDPRAHVIAPDPRGMRAQRRVLDDDLSGAIARVGRAGILVRACRGRQRGREQGRDKQGGEQAKAKGHRGSRAGAGGAAPGFRT